MKDRKWTIERLLQWSKQKTYCGPLSYTDGCGDGEDRVNLEKVGSRADGINTMSP